VTVVVLGAGSWGTAYAKVLADAGSPVLLCARRPELASAINAHRENTDYLPGVELPPTITATVHVESALAQAHIVVLAIPAQTMRANVHSWAGSFPTDSTVVSLAKGIELNTCARMSEVIAQAGHITVDRIAIVSGPNVSAEIAAEQPAATVIACTDIDRARYLQQITATGYLRPYANADVIGCELSGAVKNVIALAVGMAEGMGLGGNSTASLITRGLAEITRLGVAMGADSRTFAGLAGLGDLVATCMSPLSRNRQFGQLLAKGQTLEQATAAIKTAEGVWSCLAIVKLATQYKVQMSIVEQVARVCHEGISPQEALAELMSHKLTDEFTAF
jgi:glycerol-3-phosphate dehydrogenase (NAD(P)+)